MTTIIARVQVNGIEVGSLPRETYDLIVKSVKEDRRLYLSYAVNVIAGLWRILLLLLRSVPWLLFVMFLLLVMFDPNSFTALITELRTADPAEITKAVQQLLIYSWFILCGALPIAIVLCPSTYSFNNPFSEAVSHRIRSMLEVPTEGQLTVTFSESKTKQRD